MQNHNNTKESIVIIWRLFYLTIQIANTNKDIAVVQLSSIIVHYNPL